VRRLVAALILAAVLTGCFSDVPSATSAPWPHRAPLALPPERHHAEQNISFTAGSEGCLSGCVNPVGAPTTIATEIGFAKGLVRYAIAVEWAPADAATQRLRMVVHDTCGANDTVILGAPPLRVDAPAARPLCDHVRLEFQEPGVEAGPALVRNQEALPVRLKIDWEDERLTPLPS
jgi:hypothetical protein